MCKRKWRLLTSNVPNDPVIWVLVDMWINYSYLNIIKVIKPRSSISVLQVHPVGRINKILYRICFGHLWEKRNLNELEGNRIVIFRWILGKCVVRIWTWLNWVEAISSSILLFVWLWNKLQCTAATCYSWLQGKDCHLYFQDSTVITWVGSSRGWSGFWSTPSTFQSR